jgi:hypothetical protein
MASIVPQEFNWTKARAECSAVALFKQLQLGIENDIASLHSKPYPGLDEGFASALTKDGSRLIVAHRSNRGPRVVFFVSAGSIEIRDEASGKTYVAVAILNDEGRCKLQIDGKELELWQVRRIALETLFFGDALSPRPTSEDQS